MKTLFALFLLFFTINGYGMARKYTVDEQTRRTIHGASESISSGRIDTADLILIEGKRVTPAPKVPIKITPVKDKKGNTIVVLPAKLNNKLVVSRDSEEFQSLLQDRVIKKQYDKSTKEDAEVKRRMEGTIRKVSDEKRNAEDRVIKLEDKIKKEEAKKLSLFQLIRVGIGCVLGLVILCFIYVISKIVMAIVALFKRKE